MDFIKKITEKQDPSFEELIDCLEKVKENGAVAVVKFDGERDKDGYTVFISFPNSKREMIRADENDLKKALIKVLARYLEASR
ncbi:MAG: hypothetical protein ACOYXT_22080 [Bacteroidota bacterium]